MESTEYPREAIRHVDAKYEQFDVMISYTCPGCGKKHYRIVDSGDVYWMNEAGLEATCDKCGAKFFVWEV